MSRFILLSTLQSTGTWWVINALRNHPEIGGLCHVHNIMALKNDWVLRDRWAGNPHGEAVDKEGRITLLYEHWNPPAHLEQRPGGPIQQFWRWNPQTTGEHLMTVVPSLSPLRDPLLCLIRAWHREPPLYPYDWLIDAWEHVAKRGSTLGTHFWQMEPFNCRGFIDALEGCGLTVHPSWVEDLTPDERINATPGEESLREAYANRDTVAIMKALPKPWRRLREAEPILRPFLTEAGFTDLMWWS